MSDKPNDPGVLDVGFVTVKRRLEPHPDGTTGDALLIYATPGMSVVEALGMLRYAEAALLEGDVNRSSS